MTEDAMTEQQLREAIDGKPIPDRYINGSSPETGAIDEAFLAGQIESLRKDQADALAVVNQCSGAIALCEAMLAKLRA